MIQKKKSVWQQRFLLQPFLARIAAVAVQSEAARGNQDRVPKREDERDREFHLFLFMCDEVRLFLNFFPIFSLLNWKILQKDNPLSLPIEYT